MTNVAETYNHGQITPHPYRGGELPAINGDLIVGLELEVEAVNWNGDIVRDTDRLGFRVHNDGSLRDVNGLPAYEFISKPMAIKHALHSLTEFYKKANFSNENQNFSDRTSVHVHVNCLDLEWETLACVALLYTVMEAPLFEFINTDPSKPEGHWRDTNIYCIPWAQCRDHYGLVSHFLNNPNGMLARWQKYTALNLLPLTTQGTVEFRHMHGTSDMVKLTKWLNMIGGIFKFAKDTKLSDLEKEVYNLNTVSHYEQFFRTVLANQIEYDPTYAQLLEEGTILAKYALHSSKRPKDKKEERIEVPVGVPNADDLWHQVAAQRAAMRFQPPGGWPPRGGVVMDEVEIRPAPAGAALLARDEIRWPSIPPIRNRAWAQARGFVTNERYRDERGVTTMAWRLAYDTFVQDYRRRALNDGYAV